MAAAMPSGDADDDFAEAHEINVTPFIDVILVLLIIFMVAAPLSTVELPIDLPTASAAPQKKPEKPVYVSLGADLSLAIGENPVPRGELTSRIAAEVGDSRDRRIYLRADKSAPYGELMAVLDLLKNAGFTKIALVALEGAKTHRTAGANP
jgi:biopolymer transport protein ExbD